MKAKKTERLEGPFEVHDLYSVADSNGHICSCDKDWMAQQICAALNKQYPVPKRRKAPIPRTYDTEWLEKVPRS